MVTLQVLGPVISREARDKPDFMAEAESVFLPIFILDTRYTSWPSPPAVFHQSMLESLQENHVFAVHKN